jgi:hypothetical protein
MQHVSPTYSKYRFLILRLEVRILSNSIQYKGYVMCDPVQYAMDFAVVRDDDGGDIVDRKPSGSPYCLCERCANMETEAKKPAKFDGYMRIDPDKVDTMLPHQYFICARDTYAFIFHIREWSELLREHSNSQLIIMQKDCFWMDSMSHSGTED